MAENPFVQRMRKPEEMEVWSTGKENVNPNGTAVAASTFAEQNMDQGLGVGVNGGTA